MSEILFQGKQRKMFDIIRVFPRRTSYTPDDDMAFVGMPTLLIPEHMKMPTSLMPQLFGNI